MENKSKLLKIMGILIIIGAALGIITTIIPLFVAGILGTALVREGAPVIGWLLIVVGIISMGRVIFQLIAGIAGVKNCNKPEKAKTCIIYGLVIIAFSAIGIIMRFFEADTYDFWFIVELQIIPGIIIPGLYLLGALQLKKLAE